MTKEDIDDALLELVDDGWYITHMTSKDSSNQISIKKKKNKECSRYPIGSGFYYSEISHIIERIENMVKIVGLKVCEHEPYLDSKLDGEYITGVWNNSYLRNLEKYKNTELLGIRILYIIKEDVIKKYSDFLKK